MLIMDRVLLMVLVVTLLDTTTRASSIHRRNGDDSAEQDEEFSFDDPRLLPGIRARLTQKAFDLAARLGTDAMMQQVNGLDIPDITASAAGSNLRIHNMRIVEFARPISSLSSAQGRGLYWKSRDVQLKLEASFELRVGRGFFSITKRGSFVARGDRMVFDLNVPIGRDSAGRPMPYDIQCRAYGGDMDVDFEGAFSAIFNFAFNAFKSNIKSAIRAQICAKAEEEINNQLLPQISRLPVSITIDNLIVFDYRLVKFPFFGSEYMETHHKGAISFLADNATHPDFWPPVIPEYANHTEHMAYLYVTDFVMNSGFDAAFQADRLSYSITEDMVPEEMRGLLRTSCSFTDLCIGAIFPTLEEMYPPSMAGLDIYATEAPIGHFSGNEIQLNARGEAQFYITPEGTRVNLFTINMTLSTSVAIFINDNRVTFEVRKLVPEADVLETNIGDIGGGTLFETVMRVALRQFVMPKIAEIGRNGFAIPPVDKLNITHLQILDHEADGIFIATSDVDIQLR